MIESELREQNILVGQKGKRLQSGRALYAFSSNCRIFEILNPDKLRRPLQSTGLIFWLHFHLTKITSSVGTIGPSSSGWSRTPWRSPSAPWPSTSRCWCWRACGPGWSVRGGGGGRGAGRRGWRLRVQDLARFFQFISIFSPFFQYLGRCGPRRRRRGRGGRRWAAGCWMCLEVVSIIITIIVLIIEWLLILFWRWAVGG